MNQKAFFAGGLALVLAAVFLAVRGTSGDKATETTPVSSRDAAQGAQSTGLRSDGEARFRIDQGTGPRERSIAERTAEMENILNNLVPLTQAQRWLDFVNSIEPGEFEAVVVDFVANRYDQSNLEEFKILLSAWAKVDPLGTITWVDKNYAREKIRANFASKTILTTWALNDPQAAIRWAESNRTGDRRDPYMTGLIRGIAGSDRELAISLLTTMPDGQDRYEGLDAVLSFLLLEGNEATRTWIDNIGDDYLRESAMVRVAGRLAATDPAGTAAWLTADGSWIRSSLDVVYKDWVSKDERAAMASFESLPAGENRSYALRGIIDRVAGDDPMKAVSIMDRYPSDVTHLVVYDFVMRSNSSNPALAINQISRAKTDLRYFLYGRTLGNWMKSDRAAATAWMNSNAVPENDREFIQREFNETN